MGKERNQYNFFCGRPFLRPSADKFLFFLMNVACPCSTGSGGAHVMVTCMAVESQVGGSSPFIHFVQKEQVLTLSWAPHAIRG